MKFVKFCSCHYGIIIENSSLIKKNPAGYLEELFYYFIFGDDRTRTDYPYNAIVMLYQVSYIPVFLLFVLSSFLQYTFILLKLAASNNCLF